MSDPGPVRSAAWEAPAIGLGFLLALGGASWWAYRSINSEAETGRSKFERAAISPDYARHVGDRSCRECHPGESAAHSRSGHAKTLRPAARVESARKLDGRQVADLERSGVSWRFALVDGRLEAVREEGGRAERYPIDYALGSRRHASTFVTLLARDPSSPTLLEHRLSDFAAGNRLVLTPGQMEATGLPGTTPHGREVDASGTMKCLGLPRHGAVGPRPVVPGRGDDDPQRLLRAVPRPGRGARRGGPPRADRAGPGDAGRDRPGDGPGPGPSVRRVSPDARDGHARPHPGRQRGPGPPPAGRPASSRGRGSWTARPATTPTRGPRRTGRPTGRVAWAATARPTRPAARSRRPKAAWDATCPGATWAGA